MNRTWADDAEQAMVFSVENADDFIARAEDGFGGALGDGEFFLEENWGKHYLGPLDAEIVGAAKHCLLI
jgi:hypothetical protein